MRAAAPLDQAARRPEGEERQREVGRAVARDDAAAAAAIAAA
jgi:hypothetical protein